jgi:ABC-type glycerol-3-phosphate transport system substrate-binding protein
MQQITRSALTRRQVLAGSAAAATAVPLVHVSAQGSAGRLRCGFWDHWVPAGNGALRELCAEWGTRERVEVTVDFITSTGNQIQLAIAAQAQSKSGHDILSYPTWQPAAHAELLEPVDDVMGRLIQKYGEVNAAAEFLGKVGGKWISVPAVSGTQNKPSCVRIDLFKQHVGLDPQAMWPAQNRRGWTAEGWTWEAFARAAERCNAAGVPFGLPMGDRSDAVDWVGAVFASYGADLTDKDGRPTVRNNPKVREAVDMMVRISKALPPDVWAWDDAGNNRALISGRSALIFNPPSAWAVAKRDAPQVAEQCWTMPMPAGPEGRFIAYLPYFWGIWNFGRNKPTAKLLLEFLSQRESAEKMTNTSNGYDIPPFLSMNDFKVWETEGPPVGSVFNYPLKDHHNARASVAMAPAPHTQAFPMYEQGLNTKLIARIVQGNETVDQALTWLEREINNIRRGG